MNYYFIDNNEWAGADDRTLIGIIVFVVFLLANDISMNCC